jgi:hypothetical protein
MFGPLSRILPNRHGAAAVAGLLCLGPFAALAIGLGSDFYACEVQRIPNCD